ncbi:MULTISPECIES: ComF family protein [unclassified Agarivorans]|uniref:ComF family protein n=1 Tax=unclassified Agarivorans TaxID=2636026 RepID=UPI003D7DA3E2
MLSSFAATLNRTLKQSSQCDFCLQSKAVNLACCEHCARLLLGQAHPRCERCFLALAEPGICGECQQQELYFDHIFCLGDYQWPLSPVIKTYKYAKQAHLAKPLSQLLWQQIERQPMARPDALCSVPMHWLKRWRRGFNQSELLCQQVAALSGLPYQTVLSRPHAGSNQATLNRTQRQRSLTSSFSCKIRNIQPHWALIDDVVTTGSTANVLAKLLKQAGAQQVDIWALARTPKPNSSSQA